jgi:hypothetical protein
MEPRPQLPMILLTPLDDIFCPVVRVHGEA